MKDRCKLFCRVVGSTAYYQLRDRVIDGTPCGQDTSDICVQGLCRVSPKWCFHHFVVLISCHGFLGWGTAANISREVLKVGSPEQHQHHLILMHAKVCEPLPWIFLYIRRLSGGLHKTSPWKYNNFHMHSFTVTSVLKVKHKYPLIATSISNSSAPERCHQEELASLRSVLLILSRIASTWDMPVICFEREINWLMVKYQRRDFSRALYHFTVLTSQKSFLAQQQGYEMIYLFLACLRQIGVLNQDLVERAPTSFTHFLTHS